jgi:inner membrane protein
MPFDGTWFYGDAMFIVDPWLWLLGAAAVVSSRTRGPLGMAVWLSLGAATSWLVATHELGSAAVSSAWFMGILAIAAWRWRGAGRAGVPRVALVALGCMALYIGANLLTSVVARREIGAALAAEGLPAAEVVVSPVAARPLLRQATVVLPGAYRFYTWRLGGGIEVTRPPRVRRPLGDVALAATRAPELRGLMNWLRLRELEVVEVPEGYRVAVHDMRPGRRRDTERARVWLSPSLQVLRVER